MTRHRDRIDKLSLLWLNETKEAMLILSLWMREAGAMPARPRHCDPDEFARKTHWGVALREGAEEDEGKPGYRIASGKRVTFAWANSFAVEWRCERMRHDGGRVFFCIRRFSFR